MELEELRAIPWYALSSEEALKALESDISGLSFKEASSRLKIFGANIVPRSKRPGFLQIYFRQFKNPLIYILLFACVISFIIQHLNDAFFIFAVLQINAIIGAIQEWKAETQAESLNKILVDVVTVRREKEKLQIKTSQLVPGDIIILESGCQVPADARLVKSHDLCIDESTLTGESFPIQKRIGVALAAQTPWDQRTNMVFASSIVLSGRAEALVVQTGARMDIGRIAYVLTQTSGTETPLLIRMAKFTKFIGTITILLILLIGLLQILQGHTFNEVFLVGIALAVSAIPEGLPAALTVTLSVARFRMGRRNVIVRSLPAVEGLGACTYVASDKTGTLTCNQLTVKKVYIPHKGMFEVGGQGYTTAGKVIKKGSLIDEEELGALQKLAITGALCNEASLQTPKIRATYFGDTVDVAFLILAIKLGLNQESLSSLFPEVHSIPFESSKKFAASYNKDGKSYRVHVKGAAEVILSMCKVSAQKHFSKIAEQLANDGYRVLALATAQITSFPSDEKQRSSVRIMSELPELEFLGLVGIIDPVRAEAIEAVKVCKKAGIQVVMITGDHPATALAIARKLGIAHTYKQVVTGEQLSALGSNFKMIDSLIQSTRVFARVGSTQKLMIVEAAQRMGHFVAVTGDGVNDAPALYKANIGVAMGKGGTDIARSAADIILVDDNFASIIAGIFEGRVAYSNIRKVIYLLISTGLAEIVLFITVLGANLPIPLFATQLLWLNLVTESIQHIALAFERENGAVLREPPRSPQEAIFNQLMIEQILISGAFMGLAAFT